MKKKKKRSGFGPIGPQCLALIDPQPGEEGGEGRDGTKREEPGQGWREGGSS